MLKDLCIVKKKRGTAISRQQPLVLIGRIVVKKAAGKEGKDLGVEAG